MYLQKRTGYPQKIAHKTHFFVSSGCSKISHFEVVTATGQTKDSITKNAYNRTGDKLLMYNFSYNKTQLDATERSHLELVTPPHLPLPISRVLP